MKGEGLPPACNTDAADTEGNGKSCWEEQDGAAGTVERGNPALVIHLWL
jgi:hypothetical protein